MRIVAATNRDLALEISEKRFRDDLFYRLGVLTVTMPPLRDRVEEIPALVQYLLSVDIDHFLPPNSSHDWRIEPQALDALTKYSWPGNVRELKNVLKRAQILAKGGCITSQDLPDEVIHATATPPLPITGELTGAAAGGRLDELETKYVVAALEAHHWNKSRAANTLGISRQRLYRLISKYHLTPNTSPFPLRVAKTGE